jgi:hypothetical protein
MSWRGFSFFPLDDFPGQVFCTWGIFEVVEDADEEVLARLRADVWEPRNDSTRKLFFVLQLAQTLIVSEKYHHRYWARTADIQFAADYPVPLTYQTANEDPLDSLSANRVHGTCALIEDETSIHLYTADQLDEEYAHLLARIRAGMLVVPHNKFIPQNKVQHLANLRRSRWRQTHEAAQQLAKLYWDVYQREDPSADGLGASAVFVRLSRPLPASGDASQRTRGRTQGIAAPTTAGPRFTCISAPCPYVVGAD